MTLPEEIPSTSPDDSILRGPVAYPKYCPRCGALWHPDWDSCPKCATSVTPPTMKSTSLGPALSLYFTLLGLSMAGIVAIACGASSLPTEFVLTGLQAVIIVAWCIPSRAQILPALIARVNPRWFLIAAALAVCTFTTATVFLSLLHRALGVSLLKYDAPYFEAGYGWPTIILSIAVMPAVFEELAFRGVILSSLCRAMSSTEAGFVSALMFMVLHLSVPSFPHLFLLGLALAYLRIKSGSLFPGMVLHFSHNLLCVVTERQVLSHFFL